MNIIFVSKFKGKPHCCQIDSARQMFLYLGLIGVLAISLVYSGYWFGSRRTSTNNMVALKNDISVQKDMIKQARLNAKTDLDALAMRIGKMQANVIRLNALGKRLIKVAKLDKKEFNFDKPPAYGGPAEPESQVPVNFTNVVSTLNSELNSRESQLTILENILLNRQVEAETTPSGRPVLKGWTSSYFGMRIDPFTGKLAMHKGMDFAGKEGSKVIAAASGIVTWAGPRSGYGNLIEIDHGNGYSTRYGHNEKVLVKVGEKVDKGQVISLMGSTGRSTGPHVHFEVLKNHRQINPARFVAAK